MTAKRYLLLGSHRYALPILRPLQETIRRRNDEAAWFFDGRGGGAAHLHPDEPLLLTPADVRSFNPRAIFVAGNFVPDFFPGLKVQMFHGFNVRKRSEEKGHFRIRGLFDLYCTQGPSTTEPFQQLAARHGHFLVIETGWPKVDPLFPCGTGVPPVPPSIERKSKPVIFYASTFTPALSSADTLFPTIARLVESDRWRWIITLHPKMDRAIVDRYRTLGDRVNFVETEQVIPAMREADVMLCDTSSISSEFMLQYRPVVTFRTRIPEPWFLNVTEQDDVEPAIAKALEYPEALLDEVRRYADSIHPYRDGRSSERVLDATESVFESGAAKKLRRKPLTLWRRVEMRWRHRYWGFS